jgi:hypothetical protein
MGHRANYVIVQEGETEIYQSGWGALSIVHDVFFGPEVTAAFMRSHLTNETLYDEVWCEGAALLDLTEKRLLFFSWYDLNEPIVVKHYLAMLQANYPGWHTGLASGGIREICLYIGHDLSEVVSEDEDLDAADIKDIIGQEDEGEPAVSTDDQAITIIEEALLSADAKSLDLQQWLQRNFSDKGLTAVASHFVPVEEAQEAKAQSIREIVTRYRAALHSE